MKMAFVVLVLFVGYNSGVIVPSVVLKAINKTILTSSLNKSKEISMENNLEKSNKIDEKELFQTAADKDNVINERSFVFINQRFKTPLRNQLYNSQTHNLNKPFTISDRLPKVNIIPPSYVNDNEKSIKELFIPNIKIKGNVQSRYGPQNHEYLNPELKNRLSDDKYTLQQVKPAVIGPLSQKSEEIINGGTVANSEDTIKHFQNKKPQDTTSYARHRINYYYGFPSYQAQGSVFRNNDLLIKPNDINREGSLDDRGNTSPLDLNDEDILLERYIKETLEEFDVNDMVANNNPKKCQKCKSKGNITKGQMNAIANCKCPKINTVNPQNTINAQKADINVYESDNALKNPSLESNESDRLFAYGDDKTIDDPFFRDIN